MKRIFAFGKKKKQYSKFTNYIVYCHNYLRLFLQQQTTNFLVFSKMEVSPKDKIILAKLMGLAFYPLLHIY